DLVVVGRRGHRAERADGRLEAALQQKLRRAGDRLAHDHAASRREPDAGALVAEVLDLPVMDEQAVDVAVRADPAARERVAVDPGDEAALPELRADPEI